MISFRNADKIIQSIFPSKIHERDVVLIYDSKLDVLGNTDFYSHNFIVVEIKCPKLFNAMNGIMTNRAFTIMLIVAYHELQHLLQHESFFVNTKNINLAIEEYAHWKSRDYYNATYKNNICEIDAERNGLSKTQKLLTNILDEQEANELIAYYIKRKIQNNNYFDIEDFVSVDDIISVLDEKFIKYSNHLELFNYPSSYRANLRQDAFYDTLFNRSGRYKDYQYDKITDGWKQRKFMVFIAYKYNGLATYITKDHILYHESWLQDPSILLDKVSVKEQIFFDLKKFLKENKGFPPIDYGKNIDIGD